MKKRRKAYRRKRRLKKLFLILIFTVLTVSGFHFVQKNVIFPWSNSPTTEVSKKEANTSGDWKIILVNREYSVPKDYTVELTELSNGKKVDSRIYPALQQMFDDARANGLALFVREAYRTHAEQQQILDDKIQKYEDQGYSIQKATQLAEEYVALPGTSEHELGLSVDINADTSRCSADAVYDWLDENAYQYGFIKRYPADKTKITGINNEPWHYRYVGTKAAKIMKEENLCLEEYLNSY